MPTTCRASEAAGGAATSTRGSKIGTPHPTRTCCIRLYHSHHETITRTNIGGVARSALGSLSYPLAHPFPQEEFVHVGELLKHHRNVAAQVSSILLLQGDGKRAEGVHGFWSSVPPVDRRAERHLVVKSDKQQNSTRDLALVGICDAATKQDTISTLWQSLSYKL